ALSTIYILDSPFFWIIKKSIQLSGFDISTLVMPPVLPSNEEHISILKQILQRGVF
ncbi:dihydrodipicolinate synthase family protein, partial [Salmonella enterica subsp. enterica serovar Enteritidis]